MADLTVKGVVEWVLKSKGLREAVDRLRFVRKESDKTRRSFRMMGEAARSAFGRKLVGALGGAALLAFLKQSVAAFAQYERQLNVIERRLRELDAAHSASRAEIDAFFQSIESTTGILRQDLAPEFQKLLGILGDAKAAMAATKLAANMAEAGVKDFGGAATMIGSLLQGELIEPAKSLGIAVRDANGNLRDAGEIVDELVAKYGDLGNATKDTEGNIGSLKAGWNAFVMAVGDGASKTYNWISQLVGQDAFGALLKALKSLGPLAVLAFAKIAGGVSGVVAVVKEAASAIKDLDFSGMRERLADAWKGAGAEWKDLAEGAVLELDLLWAKGGEQSAKSFQEGFQRFGDQVKAAHRAKQEQARQKEIEEQRKAAEKRAQVEMKAEEDLLRQKLQLAERGSRERLELELQLLDLQKRRELAAAEGSEEAKAAIEEKYRLRRLELWNEYQEFALEKLQERQEFEKEMQEALLEDQLSSLQEWSDEWLELQMQRLDEWHEYQLQKAEELGADKAAIEELYARKEARIRAKYEKAKADLEKAHALQRIEQAQTVANYLAQIGGALFGQNKTWAIAMALINTYLAITKALASVPYPMNLLAAAATAAQGFLQVKRIRSTKAPEGFDDPVNDRLARFGGRRWAQDLVREIGLGFSEGLREAAGVAAAAPSSPVPSPVPAVAGGEQVTIQLHFNSPVVGGRAGVQELIRAMDRELRRGRPWRYS